MDDLVEGGVVVTKYGHAGDHHLEKIRLLEAGHPLPDENGLIATQEIIRLAIVADVQALVVTLISGGGSALLVSPPPGITLADKQRTTGLLLKSGADIFELNAVRKHLSQVKGGRLAEVIQPAANISLILSDVPGDRLDVIASGPTAPDSTTFGEALAVLETYRLIEQVPAAVLHYLSQGRNGMIPETPKQGNPCFQNSVNRIIGNLEIGVNGAVRTAEAIDLEVERIGELVTGEAREAGIRLALRALEVRKRKCRRKPVCIIGGGETTVTVTGTGSGGRNMELALAFARELEGIPGITLLSAGTDGNDGPSDAAGAFADGMTIRRARDKGLDPAAYLANNDSYNFFKEEGGLFVTGPTGTNVMDLQIVMIK
jgi:glycerate 2-kinase